MTYDFYGPDLFHRPYRGSLERRAYEEFKNAVLNQAHHVDGVCLADVILARLSHID